MRRIEQAEPNSPRDDLPQAGLSFSDWNGCYDKGWKGTGLLIDEAFAHPAKFSYGLIARIVQHGLAEGYWSPGDLVGDPFAGVACGGLMAAFRGLRWIGVELEPRFVALAQKNIERNRYKLEAVGDPIPAIVQGDSRRFAEIVGRVGAVVTSPPYAESHVDYLPSRQIGPDFANKGIKLHHSHDHATEQYGSTPGQIGSLPAGQLDGCVTSPPYAESIQGDHAERETAEETAAKRKTPGGSLGKSQRHGGYGVTDGQIGALKLDACVTSPPFQQSDQRGADHGVPGKRPDGSAFGAGRSMTGYPQSRGQLGQMSAETYWQAVAAVYEQCRLALKPGGYLVVVVKSYVKDGKIVDLPGDTGRLLESLGFHVFERTRAWLVKHDEQPSLFGGKVKRTKSRKSFFRRLAEAKGSPRIDWEEVIWSRKV